MLSFLFSKLTILTVHEIIFKYFNAPKRMSKMIRLKTESKKLKERDA